MNLTEVGDSKIYLCKESIDIETLELIKKMNTSPALNNIRVMPDCHSSTYCCVGMTSLIEDKVIPQIVGGDIGCGIIVYNLNKVIKEKHYKKIDEFIKKNIPMGDKSHKTPIIDDNLMNMIYEKCNEKLGFLKERFPDYNYNNSSFDKNYYKKLVSKLNAKVSSNNFLRSMGSLGGGNHYIEFNKEDNGNCYLSIHSGSRFLGQAICNYHQDKIRLKKTYDKKLFLNNFLEGDECIEYLIDMIFAQEFASFNRYTMMQIILDELGVEFKQENLIETIHNYIDFKRLILRKGAISAEKDELCIISLNMKDGILICKGKGNSEWNYSSAHGCGRIMSRRDAVKSFNMKDYKNCMKDIYSSCVNKDTLDEIPLAYKDVEFIKNSIGDNVIIIKQLKPIINIKGY